MIETPKVFINSDEFTKGNDLQVFHKVIWEDGLKAVHLINGYERFIIYPDKSVTYCVLGEPDRHIGTIWPISYQEAESHPFIIKIKDHYYGVDND